MRTHFANPYWFEQFLQRHQINYYLGTFIVFYIPLLLFRIYFILKLYENITLRYVFVFGLAIDLIIPMVWISLARVYRLTYECLNHHGSLDEQQGYTFQKYVNKAFGRKYQIFIGSLVGVAAALIAISIDYIRGGWYKEVPIDLQGYTLIWRTVGIGWQWFTIGVAVWTSFFVIWGCIRNGGKLVLDFDCFRPIREYYAPITRVVLWHSVLPLMIVFLASAFAFSASRLVEESSNVGQWLTSFSTLVILFPTSIIILFFGLSIYSIHCGMMKAKRRKALNIFKQKKKITHSDVFKLLEWIESTKHVYRQHEWPFGTDQGILIILAILTILLTIFK